MLKYLPTSLRIARIHSSLELLSLGNLWKDIFILSSRYVFLVHSGTRQFLTISKLTCSYVYVFFFEVDWSGPYDLVSVQALPGLSARRQFLNKVYGFMSRLNGDAIPGPAAFRILAPKPSIPVVLWPSIFCSELKISCCVMCGMVSEDALDISLKSLIRCKEPLDSRFTDWIPSKFEGWLTKKELTSSSISVLSVTTLSPSMSWFIVVCLFTSIPVKFLIRLHSFSGCWWFSLNWFLK